MSLTVKVLIFAILGFGLVSHSLAGVASCVAGWEWANNSLGQNACEVAGDLQAACEGYAAFYLDPLPSGAEYLIPQPGSSNLQCCCNTVMYSLYMTCTACQGATIQTWRTWDTYCNRVYVSWYPNTIPTDTKIPNWAFQDVTANNTIDFSVAKVQALSETPVPLVLSIVPSSSSSSTSQTTSSAFFSSSFSSTHSFSTTSSTLFSTPSTSSSSSSKFIISSSSQLPSAASSVSFTYSLPSSSFSALPTTISSGTPVSSAGHSGSFHSSTITIVGGVTGGVALFVIAGLIALYFVKRRRDSMYDSDSPSYTSSSSSYHQAKLNSLADPSMFFNGDRHIPSLRDHTTTTRLDGLYHGVAEL